MKITIFLLLFPVIAWSQPQPLQFQLQPGAFPVTVNGFPTFQPWAGGMDFITPKFCDIDADGDLDFFCGDYRGYVNFYRNIGSSTIPNLQYQTCFYDSMVMNYFSHGYSDINFADINADGLLEAFVGGSYVFLYHNLGTSTQPNFYGAPDTLFDVNGQIINGTRVALADIDGDGKIDLFAGHYDGHLKYYHNVGTPQNYAFQLVSSNWFNTYTSEGYNDPCFGDLDGDGDLDLLIGTGGGHVMYYRNDGSPTNPQMTLVTTNYLGINVQADASPELADIDGDGDLDLFVGRSSAEGQNPTQGSVFFYRNEGTTRNPNFVYITSNYLTWDCGYSSTPQLVDVDGDGLPDLLSHIGSHLIFYKNMGTPGNPNFVYQSSNYGGIDVTDLLPWFVDINGDGLLDIIAGTSAIPGPPGLKLFLNQGTPQVPNWVLTSNDLVPGVFNQTSVILSPTTADIDGDGDQDLFVSDDNDYFYFFRNIGSPTNPQFQYVTNNWQNITVPGSYYGHRYPRFYDIDADGDQDLFIDIEGVYWLPFEKKLQFYRNVGTPQNAIMQLENSDLFPNLMIWQAAPYVIDIDGDGKGDLFVGDMWGGCRFFRNVGNSPVPPNPKYRPHPEREITILPNPGNGSTSITYTLLHTQHVNLSVYNILGSRLATLVDGLQQPGEHVTSWDATWRASGIYLVRLESLDFTATQKVVIAK